jgi:hypothetical protein
MQDSRPCVEAQSTITSIAAGRADARRAAAGVLRSPEHALLAYMGSMIVEFESMATAADLAGLADILGCARREVSRAEARLTPRD